MRINKSMFKNEGDTIFITNIRNIDPMLTSPRVVEVCFNGTKSGSPVVFWVDGIVKSASNSFRSVNRFLKQNPDFDLIVDDDVREFELGF